MKSIRTTLVFLLGLGLFSAAGSSQAALYAFEGVVTLCTGTCDSFASLDVGVTLDGTMEIDTEAGGSWSFANMGSFELSLENPFAPLEPFNGANPTTANPLPIVPQVAPIAASAGGFTTGGTTDVLQELSSGTILHEFIVPPFNSNGVWIIFDIGPGGVAQAQLCLFFPTAGCIPGATQSAIVEGQFTLVPEPSMVALLPLAIVAAALRSRREPSHALTRGSSQRKAN